MDRFAFMDFEEALDERDGGGGDSGDAAGLAECGGADAGELLDHLARETGAGGVVECCGNSASFVGAEASHGFLLLREIAGEFDLGFDGFEFVADPGRERLRRRRKSAKPRREDCVGFEAREKRGEKLLDGDGGALEELGEEIAAGESGRRLGRSRLKGSGSSTPRYPP